MENETTDIVADQRDVAIAAVGTQAEHLEGMSPLLKLAADDVPIETIKELVTLYREERAHRAEQEFAADFASFQADCPTVRRNQQANFATKSGQRVRYRYADLAQIATTVRPHLHKYGFSYAWERAELNGVMTVICRLTHRGGHSKAAEFSVPIEGTPMMSEPQKHKAALTFAERVSLAMVLGLTDTDEDTDAIDPDDMAVLTPDQIMEIEDRITKSGADRDRFLAWLGVERLEDVASSRYAAIIAALKRKERP